MISWVVLIKCVIQYRKRFSRSGHNTSELSTIQIRYYTSRKCINIMVQPNLPSSDQRNSQRNETAKKKSKKMMSIVTLEKPISKIALADWQGKVTELRQTCDSRRADAFNLRNESRQMRNETNCKTQWDTYHNNVRLADRIAEITRWREIINNCLKAVEKEMADLALEKEITETEIENLNLNFTLVNECLSMRDQRGGSDLCRDEAEIELKHELSTLESLKKMLTEKAQAAWEQINRLEEVKFQLKQDLLDKDETLEICRNNLSMDKNCANTSYKPDCLRLPKKLISYESWLEHCKYLKLRADNELEAAQKLRETMYVPRERAQNDLKAQSDATNFALRKRIYETQRIKNELDWQRFNMIPDMDRLMKELTNLEAALEDKTNALKLAETRCENRLYRPGAELCRDEPALGLADEVCQLRRTRRDLQEKIDTAKATFNALEDQLMIIDRELYNKNQAMTTDLRCLELRSRLTTGRRAEPATQTERNIVLTRMTDEIPPE